MDIILEGGLLSMPINTKTAEFPLKKVEEMIPVVINSKTFIVADTETTGFGAYDDIIEIGAIKLDADKGRILGKFSSYCHLKKHKKVPEKITKLTSIRTEDLADAPRIEAVLAGFKAFIGSEPLVFHNAVFDWRMLNTKYKMLGVCLTNEVICTMKLFKYLHPDLPTNLDYITGFYGTPIVGHHRAYVDCKWTGAAFRKMRQELMDLELEPSIEQMCFPSVVQRQQLTLEDISQNCMIQRISGWKKGRMRRIYCTTNMADFFYDITDHVWTMARNKTKCDLDPDLMAKFVLGRVGMDLADFQAAYAPG